jgi:hypothetical protein
VAGVFFGDVSATAFTVNSDTSITATAPAHSAGIVDVVVDDFRQRHCQLGVRADQFGSCYRSQ